MFVPWPVLIAIGVAFFALLVIAVKRRGGGRDLMAPPEAGTNRARPQPPPLAWDPRAPLPPEVAAEVRALVRDGRKIEAVKRVRETTGLGLKEALDLVERLPL